MTQSDLIAIGDNYFDRMIQQMARCIKLRGQNLPNVEGIAHKHLDTLRLSMELAQFGKNSALRFGVFEGWLGCVSPGVQGFKQSFGRSVGSGFGLGTVGAGFTCPFL